MPTTSVVSVSTSLRLKRDLRVAGVAADRPEAVEAGRDPAFVVVRVELVAGDLLGHEAVERLVAR